MIVSRKSRYAATGTALLTQADGSVVQYLHRRFVPHSGDVRELAQVDPRRGGTRLDLLAAHLVSDPEQFWRLLDANDGADPFDFVDDTMNRPLRIPHPLAVR